MVITITCVIFNEALEDIDNHINAINNTSTAEAESRERKREEKPFRDRYYLSDWRPQQVFLSLS